MESAQAGLVTMVEVGRLRYRRLWEAHFDELGRIVEELKQKEMVDGRKKRE